MQTDRQSVTAPASDPNHDRRQFAVAAGCTLAGLAVSLVLAAASNGVYHDDDICHFLFARDGWGSASALLHSWARPGYNLPAAAAAAVGGFAACRVLSALMTAGVAWLAFCIARRVARPGASWPAFAPLAVWAQPLVMILSFTSLTETPAALYLALGLWLYYRGNRVWASAAFSAMFVTRYETLALAPLLWAGVACDALRLSGWRVGEAAKRWWVWASPAAMLWAPAAYLAAAALVEIAPGGSPWTLFSRDYTQEYGSGAIWHFLSIWPEAAGLGLLAVAAVGGAALGRRGWFVSAVPVALVALHSLLFWRGSFATGGYARFLVPLAAPLGVLAAGGVAAAWRARSRWVAAAPLVLCGVGALVVYAWPYTVLPVEAVDTAPKVATIALLVGIALAAVASLAPAGLRTPVARVCLLAAGGALAAQLAVQVHPLKLRSDDFHRVAVGAVEAMDAEPYDDRPAISQHVLIQFLRGDVRSAFSNTHATELWRNSEPGTLFFWDNKYCYKSHEMTSTRALYAALLRRGRLVHEEELNGAVVQVFERVGSEVASQPELATRPGERQGGDL